jgi:hypothetical protein
LAGIAAVEVRLVVTGAAGAASPAAGASAIRLDARYALNDWKDF